jgi:hypothetical protein
MDLTQTTQNEEDPLGKRGDVYVYVYNMVEDEWQFIESVTHRPKQNYLIADCENAADAYFLSTATETDAIYVSPKTISPEFQEYAKQLLHFRSLEVIVPKSTTRLISDDLLKDNDSLMRLISLCKPYKRVILVSYAATPWFYALADTLKRENIPVITPEAPAIHSSWTVNFFGSKSGIRQLAQKSAGVEPDFLMADGLICVGRFDAARIAAAKFLKEKGVVIKTNKGSGGNGVLIFRENDLPNDYDACEKKILSRMNSDKYWDYFPIVIESLIAVNNDQNLSPNVEFRIHKNGRIEFLYLCSCKVTPSGSFYGVDISDDVIPDRMATQLIDMGYFIAEQYSQSGYRGHFDIDMMIGRNNKVYVCETNCRNTGGTDTYRLAKRLIGKDFLDDAYVLSRSKFQLSSHKRWSLKTVLLALDAYLYLRKTKEGIIINSENSIMDGLLIYTIFGKNKRRAYEIEDAMKQILSNQ